MATASRLAKLVSLKESIFGIKNAATMKILGRKSQKTMLLNYYPPDINIHQLANQDESLKALELRDVWLDTMLDREIMLQKRNKNVRVSVLTGMQKAPAEKSGKKKKRK
ncbi:hypothetical protein BC833DRAFT_618180 [Globomyces pollinis-pini]|nr:hypothetical protein BC833DRAFT_618180 [Globomyces pollinis-pini]